jgi:cytochrome bd-type quinol oxidase subunit 1
MSATTTTLELEMNTDMSAARFPIWMALSIFSAVALAAVTSTSEKSERESDDKWVLSVCIISMSLSFIATAAYLFGRSLFVGQKPEAVMVRA